MATTDTPAQAWHALSQGNRRFVAGSLAHPNQDADRLSATAERQSPFALVFGCMDSRVAAEIIFDRGIGDLAIVRTAGHVLDSGVLGSLEFGVTILQIPLVVVLGHDGCGAIAAALAAHRTGQMPGGYVRDIVERITPSMMTARVAGRGLDEIDPDELTEEHVRHTAHLIAERSAPIADRILSGHCAVVGAGYRLAEGRVRFLESLGDVEEQGPPHREASDTPR
jgi:carbonic anhydrase